MEYRRLGRAGLQLSALSLGAWITYGGQVGEDVAEKCMAAAYDSGVNFFDNAEAYAHGQAEIVMGNVIKKLGWRRELIVVSTKLFWGGREPNQTGLNHKHMIEGANNSLRRLQLDYVDLIYCHRPDRNTPIEETVRAMDILIKQGKAFYWGTSEWSAAEIMRADAVARQYGLTPPSMEQPEYNMFHRERVEVEYLPLYQNLGYGTTTFSPLAVGLLSGKYNQGIPADSRLAMKDLDWLKESHYKQELIEKVKALAPIAADLGCTLAQMAIAWCLKNPNVSSIITGASRPEQVHENMKALEVVPKLTSIVMEQIDAVLQNKPESQED